MLCYRAWDNKLKRTATIHQTFGHHYPDCLIGTYLLATCLAFNNHLHAAHIELQVPMQSGQEDHTQSLVMDA